MTRGELRKDLIEAISVTRSAIVDDTGTVAKATSVLSAGISNILSDNPMEDVNIATFNEVRNLIRRLYLNAADDFIRYDELSSRARFVAMLDILYYFDRMYSTVKVFLRKQGL